MQEASLIKAKDYVKEKYKIMIVESLTTQAKQFGLDSGSNLQLLQDLDKGSDSVSGAFYKISLAG